MLAASAALLLLLPGALGAQLTEPLASCALQGFDGAARCGALEVPEDPARPAGRRIMVRVAVLPSRGSSPAGAPLAILAGGPGQAATALAGFSAAAFDALRDDHDILLVDARGTGGSHPLDCAEFGAAMGPDVLARPLLDTTLLRRCRRTLEAQADLSLYTTTRIADDMVRVWDALGHDRVNLYGTSYGTRLALEIMRRHPERVRAAVLKGVAPMSLRMPLNYPRDGQRALDRIFEHCRADSACAAAYPQLDVDLHRVLTALDEGVEVSLSPPRGGGQGGTVRVHREPVAQAMMALLQSTDAGAYLPRMVHAAARGGWEPLVSFALFYRTTLAGALYEGMFLSVTCAEDLPFIEADAAAREAEDTFLGLSRYETQAAACAVWDVAPVDSAFRGPVTAAVPTLLVSGNYDPVTPPRWGWKVAERLRPVFHLVVPEGSHSFAGMIGCVDPIIARFIRSGTPPPTADPCVQNVRVGPFSLPGDPWPPFVQPPSQPETGG